MRLAMREGIWGLTLLRRCGSMVGMKLREQDVTTTPPKNLTVNQLRQVVLELRQRLHVHNYGTIPRCSHGFAVGDCMSCNKDF